MRALVTGAAGFIGSHLAETLLTHGHEVVGIDSLVAFYSPQRKRSNLRKSLSEARFDFREVDLIDVDPDHLLDGIDVVFHLAGQPGVRGSWGGQFDEYSRNNISATQRLLEAVKATRGIDRFVFASSSSVYGNASRYPCKEVDEPRPHSPYGVTKLAAEHLCRLYAQNYGVPTVCLRYFTVYGSRQRPDMAIHRLLEAARDGIPFPLYGTGSQVRDFTHVRDVVEANMAAARAVVPPGSVFNIAGGTQIAVTELIETVCEITGESIPIEKQPAQPGDVQRTGGSTERARELLGWAPNVDLHQGLSEHWAHVAGAGTS